MGATTTKAMKVLPQPPIGLIFCSGIASTPIALSNKGVNPAVRATNATDEVGIVHHGNPCAALGNNVLTDIRLVVNEIRI